ncbi:hypothetical protein FALBO_12378 [Fusarium albosuccineum]|uniref:Uncharacterized protein n=1 Tax=Fusarium albosuccineum TaxID=1237068 RepID=A0A8H4L0I9_9HYPO|nr:hypothetical protein FALBO_12378 [Fusarium albosuccineum]
MLNYSVDDLGQIMPSHMTDMGGQTPFIWTNTEAPWIRHTYGLYILDFEAGIPVEYTEPELAHTIETGIFIQTSGDLTQPHQTHERVFGSPQTYEPVSDDINLPEKIVGGLLFTPRKQPTSSRFKLEVNKYGSLSVPIDSFVGCIYKRDFDERFTDVINSVPLPNPTNRASFTNDAHWETLTATDQGQPPSTSTD